MSDFEKLINASDLIEWIMETYPDWCVGAVRGIVDHINKSPSAQPEIVRCKDCKHYMQTSCPMTGTWATDEDFCSFGERR